MVDEILTAIAVGSAMAGAMGSDFEEYWFNCGTFDKVKFARSILISIMGAFGLVHVQTLFNQYVEVGMIGMIMMYTLLGYGLDKARREKTDRSETADE